MSHVRKDGSINYNQHYFLQNMEPHQHGAIPKRGFRSFMTIDIM